jgi:hypothetical protein
LWQYRGLSFSGICNIKQAILLFSLSPLVFLLKSVWIREYGYSLFALFRLAIVLFYPSSICGLCLLLWYLRTFLSRITFIPYSLIQTLLSKKTKGDKLNNNIACLMLHIPEKEKNRHWTIQTPLKTQVLRKGKHFLLHYCHTFVLMFNEPNVIWHGNRFGHQWNKINTNKHKLNMNPIKAKLSNDEPHRVH